LTISHTEILGTVMRIWAVSLASHERVALIPGRDVEPFSLPKSRRQRARLWKSPSAGPHLITRSVMATLAAAGRLLNLETGQMSKPSPAKTARPQEQPHLSLCMIVRDNEDTLAACLESIRPWVDEMVVVDTGSRDATPRIAKDLGAKVFSFAWCDDFAAARNESLRHARGRWLFWMDSDDTIPPECGQKLRQLADSVLPPHVLGFVMQVHCPGPDPDGGCTVVDHVKMFRNDPQLRFEFRIHGVLAVTVQNLLEVLAGAAQPQVGGTPRCNGAKSVAIPGARGASSGPLLLDRWAGSSGDATGGGPEGVAQSCCGAWHEKGSAENLDADRKKQRCKPGFRAASRPRLSGPRLPGSRACRSLADPLERWELSEGLDLGARSSKKMESCR